MLVLGIDVGTSSCKVGVFSAAGMATSAACEYQIQSPRPGYAEIDAIGTWKKIKDTVRIVLSGPGVSRDDVRAVSFSSMGEAVVPVRLDRSIVGPSILAYDCRGGANADRLAGEFDPKELFAINPNIAGPQYTFAKLMWLRANEPAAYDRAEKFLFWGDFLGFMFGAEPYATKSLANRSLLLDVRGGDWSDRLVRWAGLDREKLGRVVDSGEVVGTVDRRLADELGLRRDMLIVSGGHDQGCNSLGCGCLGAGDAVVGMGTYESYTPTFAWPEDAETFRSEHMSIANHVVDGLYLSFLYHHSGLLVNWFRNAFAPDAGPDVMELLNAEMPEQPTNLLFLPHNAPPQWPYFIGDTSGVFAGLKADTSRGEMFKALLEGITYYFLDAVASMRRAHVCPDVFLASGGSSRSDSWMQIRADIIGIPFTRLSVSEGSLTGAAILAAVKAGLFSGNAEAVAAYVTRERTFTPSRERHERYAERFGLYKRLYPSVRGLLGDLSRA